MAEFQELIKNFDRIRDYMRQFYVYGFKVRNDFSERAPEPTTMSAGVLRAGSPGIQSPTTPQRESMSTSM